MGCPEGKAGQRGDSKGFGRGGEGGREGGREEVRCDDAGTSRKFTLPPSLPPSLPQGMVILDDAFGEAWAAALRAEIVFLVERGEMKPNQTRFGPQEVGREGGRASASHNVSPLYIRV